MVISAAARLVGQVGQWAMALLKGLGPHMTTLCALFWFLPYLPFQEPKLPYHLCKRCLEGESLELFLLEDSLKEAQWADVSSFLKDFRFLPYQVPKLPYQLCKMCFRKESIELFLFQDGLEEAQWADVSPLLKNFNAQWRLAADARSASKQRVSLHFASQSGMKPTTEEEGFKAK